MSEIASEYGQLFDTLTEEEKVYDFVNEDGFAFQEVKKALKNKYMEPETIEKLKSVDSLKTEEKALKKEVKKESALLQEKTKSTVENLPEEQVFELLRAKWIKPLIQNLMTLPSQVVSELVDKLKSITEKYSTTLPDVETQIEETEKELSSMIDDLEGSEFDMLGLQELKKLLGGK